jgi:hypothetical protein
MKRRTFLEDAGFLLSAGLLSGGVMQSCRQRQTSEIEVSRSVFTAIEGEKEIHIEDTGANFEREALIRPFGFKGGYMKEIWQSASMIKTDGSDKKVGLCTQNVLWSDPNVFSGHSESAANSLMFAVTERALQMIKGEKFRNPIQLQEDIFEELHSYSKLITKCPDLKETFTLNALVGVDNAVWLSYCAENGITKFDDMIPTKYRPSLSYRHKEVASVPLMAYSIPVSEIRQAVDDGFFFMKIKIGQPGTQEEMLRKDMDRLSEIHAAIGQVETGYTANGKIPYYFDANGRYETREGMLKLLDHARKIGAFDQIAIIEEPYAEEKEFDVRDLGVRIVSDETAHTDRHALERIQMGYGAIALKPIAKTMSMSMKVAQLAHEKEVPCFCADLTVNPILVEWNKNIAARLAPFPGINGSMGLCETNGHQNYANWNEMLSYNPSSNQRWAHSEKGVFKLEADYYAQSGGIFEKSERYNRWFD